MLKKRKNNIIGVFIFMTYFSTGFSQKLEKVYILESFIIKNKNCFFEVADYELEFKFKRRNKFYFLDNSDKEIVDIKTMSYLIKNDSIILGWGDSHFHRGHKLYQYCYQDFKRALNSKYQIVFKDNRVVLENNQYIFVLNKKGHKCIKH